MNMSTKERASKAAKAQHEKWDKIRLEEYLKHPNICKGCGEPIFPASNQVLSDVSKKQFHNQKCFSIFRTLPKDKRKRKPKLKDGIRPNSLLLKSKEDFSDDRHFHSRIRSNSRNIYKASGKEMKCFVCGYDIHVEICHIKDIQEFPKDAKVSEINDIDNLVALCSNCHWEFDHKMIDL